MRAVRDIWAELVERRLWPVALLLVAALVAVPVVLAKQPSPDGGGAATDAPPVAAAAAADLRLPGDPVVRVTGSAVAAAPLRGAMKNPFRQQHVPPRAASEGGTAPVAGSAPSGSSGGGSPTGGSPGGGSGGSNGGSNGGSGQPQQTYVYASIDVSFGRAGSPLRAIHDVPRLTPLPNAAEPIVIFIGMRSDHETAVFMVSTDVHAQGDGRCVPSTQVCQAIELRRDQIALLDLRAADGSVTQYELDLNAVTLHQTTSKAKASEAYARSSAAGRRLVHRSAATSAVASALRYSAATGVLTAVGGTYLQRGDDPSATGPDTPRAAAGKAPSAPVLTSHP